MSRNNRPVTSREYKLMLNTDRFEAWEQGAQSLWRLVEFLVKKQKGEILLEQDEKLERQTWYLDTPELSFRRRGFILRQRKENGKKKKFKTTLKYRNPDRYLSASRDLSATEKGKSKFEEDITPPFASKFAQSTSIKTKQLPQLETVARAMALFPGLGQLEIPEDAPIQKVNGFTAQEIAYRIGQAKFGQEPIIKFCFTFWYMQGEHLGLPLVGEFSFDYDQSQSDDDDDEIELEQYSPQVVAQTNRLFETLQKLAGWINFDATTKTAFAYESL